MPLHRFRCVFKIPSTFSCTVSPLLRTHIPFFGVTAQSRSAPLLGRHHVFLNYKQTTWKDLPAELDLGLMVLPVRVAYVDADPEVQFYDVAHAIDMIEGNNARAILLTPRSKAGN